MSMSEASNRRRQQLLDKFLAGEVEKGVYDALLDELGVAPQQHTAILGLLSGVDFIVPFAVEWVS